MLHRLLFAVMALATTSGSVAIADSPQAEHLARARVWGELIAVNDLELSVQGAAGPVTVLTDEHTQIRIFGEQDPDLGDLDVGDTVLARGMREADGVLLAAFVVREPDGERIGGRVAHIGDDGLALRSPEGVKVSVEVTPRTLVALPFTDRTWGDGGQGLVREGTFLFAFGPNEVMDATFEADTLVLIARPRHHRHAVAGAIGAIIGDTIQIETPDGDALTILTNGRTRFRRPGSDRPSLDDFVIGDAIVAFGQRQQDDTFRARLVSLRPVGRPVAGIITARDDASLFIINRSGLRLNIVTDDETVFQVGRDAEASIDSFVVGDRIVAVGQVDESGDVLFANRVAKRAADAR